MVQAGDVLVQLNSYALHRCDDLERALREADERKLIPVLIVRRDGTVHTITLELPTPTLTPAAPTAALPTPPPALPPTPAELAATGTRAAGSDAAATTSVVAAFETFAAGTRSASPSPEAFNARLAALRQTYEPLKAQAPAAAARIMDYYETAAAILTYEREHADDQVPDDNSTRRIEGNRRQPDMVYDYGGKGQVADWLSRYPFLEPAVIRAPIGDANGWQLTGRWLPDIAVRILLDRARVETAALSP